MTGNDPDKKEKLAEARDSFAKLGAETNGVQLIHLANKVKSLLSEIGAPVSALDPANRHMRADFNKAVRHAHLVRAQQLFTIIDELRAWGSIDYTEKALREHLSAAKTSWAKLDAAGRSSGGKMKERLAEAVARNQRYKPKNPTNPNLFSKRR